MNPQQEATMTEVRRLMKGQFDSFIISYRITDENLNTKINHDWHGDIVDIIGLSTITHHRMISYIDINSTPEPE